MLDDMVENWKEHPELKGRFLFDYNRAQRNSNNRDNTREAMLEYKKQLASPENCAVGFFKCPIPRKPVRRFDDFGNYGFPELASVHHYKAVICDNDVLILGGNQTLEYYLTK